MRTILLFKGFILSKAEQFGLFDMPVLVAGSVRKDGTITRPHVSTRKKRIAPQVQREPDLFGGQEEAKAQRRTALEALLRKYGGAAQVAAMLRGVPPEKRDEAIAKMAKIAKVPPAEMQHALNAAKPEDAPQGDLFAQAAAKPETEGREGYDTAVELDARKLKDIIEAARGEPLVDKPAKLEAWRNGTAKTDPKAFPVEIGFRADGKLDVNDGRHRIALAAERGEKVRAFIDRKDADRALAMAGPGNSTQDIKPPKLDFPVIEHDGQSWYVINTGAAREDGKVLAHLSSVTRGRPAKNGVHPVQMADWVDRARLGMAPPAAPLPIVEHVTAKGKTIRGVVRTDLTRQEAQDLDPYTFRKDGGWFVREKHLQAANAIDSAKADGSISEAQHAEARQALAQEGPGAAAQALRRSAKSLEQQRAERAEKLRSVADGLRERADAEMARDRQSNTARRARMAGSAIEEAAKQRQMADTMTRIAQAIEEGRADKLQGVTSKAQVEVLDYALRQAMHETDKDLSYADRQQRKGRPPAQQDVRNAVLPRLYLHGNIAADIAKKLAATKGHAKASAWAYRLSERVGKDAVATLNESDIEMARLAVKGLEQAGESRTGLGWQLRDGIARLDRLARMGILSDDDMRQALSEYVALRAAKVEEDPVKRAERALAGRKVGIDFFPTPKPLAARMAELAGVKPGMRVLEPSAGNGHLADAAKAAGAEVDAVEISDALRDVLQAKGHNIVGRDFDSHEASGQYDAVIMNPPFGDRKDAAHIMRAWDMLKTGGKLVAIAGEGVFLGSDSKAQAFRDWLDQQGAKVEKLPENTFKGADLPAQTGANARLIVIEKSGSAGAAADTGPREGEVNAEGLVFRNGRWHRDDETGESLMTAPKAAAEQADTGPHGLNAYTQSEHEAAVASLKPGDIIQNSRMASSVTGIVEKIIPPGQGEDFGQVQIRWADDGEPRKGNGNGQGTMGYVSDFFLRDGVLYSRGMNDAYPPEAWKRVGVQPGTQIDLVGLAEDKQDLAEELIRNPSSERAKELLRRVHAAEIGAAGEAAEPAKAPAAAEPANDAPVDRDDAPALGEQGPVLSIRELSPEQRKAFSETRNQRDAAQFHLLPKEQTAASRQQAKLDGIRAQIAQVESSIAFNRANQLDDEVARLTKLHGELSVKASKEHKALLNRQNEVDLRMRLVQNLNAQLGKMVRGTEDPFYDTASRKAISDPAMRKLREKSMAENGKAYQQELEARIAARKAEKAAADNKGETPAPVDASPKDGDRNADGLVFRNGRWHRDDEPQEKPVAAAADALSDDPNSPNYRYRDTGYIAGSRKEQAAQMLRDAAKSGRRVNANEVDWEQIEQNPREAKELIVKSNLFGQVPWEDLKAAGMEPGTGFLVDRVYAAIGTEPAEDSPQARKDYALGLQTLRDRLERCKMPSDVTAALDELREEYEGVVLNAQESEQYKMHHDAARKLTEGVRPLKEMADAMYYEANRLKADFYGVQREVENRKRRGWKPLPELDARLAQTDEVAKKAWDEWAAKLAETRPLIDAAENAARMHYRAAQAVQEASRARNQIENPMHRAWNTMGDRFIGVLKYRSSSFYYRGKRFGGSKAFQEHVAAVKAGRMKDWSWAETKGATRAPKATESEVRFQMKVAENFARKGGRTVDTASTEAFKRTFGLRDVQSGNWVLKDPASAKFHVEHCAGAFADLADLLGVPDAQVSLNGRLAMAFGARGTGAKGWKTGAPRAHYEPVQRVINLTKMGGGGALAHEWAHALDNIIRESVTGQAGGSDEYASSNPDLLPPGELRDAYSALRSAMLDGTVQAMQKVSYSGKDVQLADHNVGREDRLLTPIAKKIKAAGNADTAIRAVDDHFEQYGRKTPKLVKQINDWRRIAAAYYDRKPEGGSVKAKAGPTMSQFAADAADLDAGGNAYFSTSEEMFARAFQAYVEDQLSDQGRQNDYLSAFADNKYHFDPIFGIQWKPFPEGEERKRINAAFNRLVAAMRADNTLAKAIARMDAKERKVLFFRAPRRKQAVA